MSLKEIRIKRRITQKQLEAISGVDQPTISRYENDLVMDHSWKIVWRLSSALDVRPEKLFPVDSAA